MKTTTKTSETLTTTETVDVPAAACRMGAGRLTVSAEAVAKLKPGEAAPIEMLARTAEAIDHPYWFGGRVVHDMTGMTLHKERLPVDYVHEEEIGYLDQFSADATEGLTVAGALVPTSSPDDRARKILERQAGGVPYEASIDFAGPMAVEFVESGLTAEVNGQAFDGPISVVREWALRGVAVCPYGADMNTATKFAAGEKVTAKVTRFSAATNRPPSGEASTRQTSAPARDTPTAEARMSETAQESTEETPADATSDSAGTATETPTPAEAATDAPSDEATSGPTEQTKQPSAQLQKFVDAFGAQRGAEYLLAGDSFESAQTKELARLTKENAKLAQRLSGKQAAEAEGEGEEGGAGFSASDDDQGKKRTGFASKIKIK